jgi:hypothetical protein
MRRKGLPIFIGSSVICRQQANALIHHFFCQSSGSGRIVAYPDITPFFEFCPDYRSFTQNRENLNGLDARAHCQ